MGRPKSIESLEELKGQIERQIVNFDGRRTSMRKWRNFLFLSHVFISAITTIVIAANIKFMSYFLGILAAGGSVAATTASVFLSHYMFHERFIIYTATWASLHALRSKIKILEAQNADDPDGFPLNACVVDELFEEMQKVLSSTDMKWSEIMKKIKMEVTKHEINKDPNH